ncbi:MULTISPECIES: tetratricopeptide repeat protein [unclassified Variovorax]|uniref:tetratricopeptide repeat protein n=1 Tax=unclassified Variovorax TaxID=663243 RepID=UPI003F44617A
MTAGSLGPHRIFPNATDLNAISREQWEAILNGPPAPAVTWITAAAREHHAQAQAVLGQWLLDGRGVARNEAAAFGWFQRAAAQGHFMAMNMAGRCLEHGWGTAENHPEAVRLYRQAADGELGWGMYNLANMLATGRGVALDQRQAFELYLRAAGLGHARSLNMVGRYFEEGMVVAQDAARAFAFYRQSAEAGDFRGQFSYASMLLDQGEVDAAVEWFERIAASAPAVHLQRIAGLLAMSTLEKVQSVGHRIRCQTRDHCPEVQMAITPRRH